jgi:hypothetical protein
MWFSWTASSLKMGSIGYPEISVRCVMNHKGEFLKKKHCLRARHEGIGTRGVIVPRIISLELNEGEG